MVILLNPISLSLILPCVVLLTLTTNLSKGSLVGFFENWNWDLLNTTEMTGLRGIQ